MITAFSPGHVTCFFQPHRTDDPLTSGSRGAGFKTSLGTTVSLDERNDKKIVIEMDGKVSECPITEYVLTHVCPDRGFDVIIDNDLPVSQGFGMSAASALATAVAASEISEMPLKESFAIAHTSDVIYHGGLGDVAAILCKSHFPLRLIPGANGKTVDSKLKGKRMNLVVLGDTLSTKSVLTDSKRSNRIEEFGKQMIDDFDSKRNMGTLFKNSRTFSSSIGLETFEISSFLSLFEESGMCMLGHSVFTTAPEDEIRELIGDVQMFSCDTTDELPRIIRRA